MAKYAEAGLPVAADAPDLLHEDLGENLTRRVSKRTPRATTPITRPNRSLQAEGDVEAAEVHAEREGRRGKHDAHGAVQPAELVDDPCLGVGRALAGGRAHGGVKDGEDVGGFGEAETAVRQQRAGVGNNPGGNTEEGEERRTKERRQDEQSHSLRWTMLEVKTTTRVGVIPHDDTVPGLAIASQMRVRAFMPQLFATSPVQQHSTANV